jgi:hypothetical protein
MADDDFESRDMYPIVDRIMAVDDAIDPLLGSYRGKDPLANVPAHTGTSGSLPSMRRVREGDA